MVIVLLEIAPAHSAGRRRRARPGPLDGYGRRGPACDAPRGAVSAPVRTTHQQPPIAAVGPPMGPPRADGVRRFAAGHVRSVRVG